MASLEAIQQQVEAELTQLGRNPAAWCQRFESFYEACGPEIQPFGQSCLDFVAWELKRGVLDPDHGSPWWRAVRRDLLHDGLVAWYAFQAGLRASSKAPFPAPLALWCHFFDSPNAATWYRAHNSSVIAGYFEHRDLAKAENDAEQLLMNIVLYRVLFAQALVEEKETDFEPLGRVLREIADPRGKAVRSILQLGSFYPAKYPIPDDRAADWLREAAHYVEKGGVTFLDDELVLHGLSRLYAQASQWNAQPRLGLLTREDRPIYPDVLPDRRIAILGGGLGAITTALALTDPDNPEAARHKISLYQIGWRLGGKGASGRNLDPSFGARIQEHGLHIWFGFYENAFRTLGNAYKQLVAADVTTNTPLRPPDAPLASMHAAFKPFPTAFVIGGQGDRWSTWYSIMPRNSVAPDARGLLPFDQVFKMAIEFVVLHALKHDDPPPPDATLDWEEVPPQWRIAERLQTLASSGLIAEVAHFVRQSHGAQLFTKEAGLIIARALSGLMGNYWKLTASKLPADAFAERERWAVINLVYACITGILKDDLAVRGLDAVNDQDFAAWALTHAYPDQDILKGSGYLRSIYDGSFAYRNGDNSLGGQTFPPNANMEAGNTLRNAFRALFTYKQTPIFKMQAGMGDVVFGPAYEVLRQRGVTFNFFHRVLALEAAQDKMKIQSIRIGRQAHVLEGEYHPLVDVRGLPCWPDRPLLKQLAPIDASQPLEALDLEAYDNGQKMEEFTLSADEHFDEVVLGISLGAIPYICKDLIDKSPAWQRMVANVETIATQAVQITLNRTLSQMGWTPMMRPIASGFNYPSPNPLETWADMTHLVEHEAWDWQPPQDYPRSIIYFCSSFVEPSYPPTMGPGDKQRIATAKVAAEAAKCLPWWYQLIQTGVATKLPPATPPGPFPMQTLVDRRPSPTPQPPLDAQYFLANIKPSERYVLSVAGSSQHRLGPNDPLLFGNLFLAGDWTDNHVNMGCVEAAVTSGLLCSNALCSFPVRDDIAGLEW
jgi:uncharacterized protein with NAD-binding domain and iron-sulfur cluster